MAEIKEVKENSKDIKLKVQEALQEEAYKGIVRIDSQTMRSLNIKPGDVIEIEGDCVLLTSLQLYCSEKFCCKFF